MFDQLRYNVPVAFHIETSHLFSRAKQMTGFNVKFNTALKWVSKIDFQDSAKFSIEYWKQGNKAQETHDVVSTYIKTPATLYRPLVDVKMTPCVYWEGISV